MFARYHGVMKFSRTVSTGLFVAAFVLSATAAFAYPGAQFANRAKVSIGQARSIALKAAHGKIVSEELEKEKGGSGLRYTFDIKVGAKTVEIGVDAQSGKLLENSTEGSKPD